MVWERQHPLSDKGAGEKCSARAFPFEGPKRVINCRDGTDSPTSNSTGMPAGNETYDSHPRALETAGPLQDLWLTRAGGVRPVGRGHPSGLLRSNRRLKPQISHGFLAPFEGFPDASPGVLQVWESEKTPTPKSKVVDDSRVDSLLFDTQPAQIFQNILILLTRAGGVRPVGTPQWAGTLGPWGHPSGRGP